MEKNKKFTIAFALRPLKNSKGVGLVQVLIGFGLVGILSVVLMQLFDNMAQSQRWNISKFQQKEITGEIRTFFNNKGACFKTFGGMNPTSTLTVDNLLDENGTSRYTVNTQDTNKVLTFDKFELVQYTADVGTTNNQGTAQLKIHFKRGNLSGKEQSFNPMPIIMRLKLDASSNILECFSIGAFTDSYWQADSNDIANIYFGGKVGIGFGVVHPGQVSDSPLSYDDTVELEVGKYVLAQGYYWASDARLKTILEKASGLASIRKLNGYKFIWNNSQKKDMGLIAQEVEKVYPELVTSSSQNTKSVNYTGIIAALLESVKELDQQKLALEKKLDELEKRLEALEE